MVTSEFISSFCLILNYEFPLGYEEKNGKKGIITFAVMFAVMPCSSHLLIGKPTSKTRHEYSSLEEVTFFVHTAAAAADHLKYYS